MVNAPLNIKNSSNSSLNQSISVIADPSKVLDRATKSTAETWFQNKDWTTFNGFYRQYPEIQAVIDKMAMWTVGKGFKADENTTKKLEKIRGFGKDTFNNILENMVRVYLINGDSYAEIIKDKKGRIINLKPLNPGVIRIVANSQGIIKRYEQTDASGDNVITKFEPDQIFHLAYNREADEIHGISMLESLAETVKKKQQLDEDMNVVFHRYVVPVMLWKLDTDSATEIAAFKAKADKAVNNGENLYIPQGSVETDALSIPQFSTIDPLKWRQEWNDSIIKSGGVPELVLGTASDITEASSKIVYLAFQQTVERNQRFLEAQIKAQMNIEIQLEFPARIEENLGEDEGKDGGVNVTKRSEVKVTSEKIGDKGSGGAKL